MSIRRKSLYLGVALSFGIALSLSAWAASGWAASGDPSVTPSSSATTTMVQAPAGVDQVFMQAVTSDGAAPLSVSMDEATNALQIVFKTSQHGASGDAWAIMTAKREANYLAKSGALKVGSLDVNVIDESGASVWRAIEPIEPADRPAASAPTQDTSSSFTAFVNETAAEAGFDLAAVSLRGDQNLGLVANVRATVPAGPAGVDAAPLMIRDVLPRVLDYMAQMSVQADLLHLSVQDKNGSLLIDYVIDPTHGAVMVWGAPGVEKVWVRPAPPTPSEVEAPTTALPLPGSK